MNNTEDALDYMLTGAERRLRGLRKNGGDILALQALTYMFSGNPVAMLAHQGLAQESLSCAESVRNWCLDVFKRYGGTGPEVMDRVLGPERVPLQAAHQALTRFSAFVERAAEVMRQAPVPAAPAGVSAQDNERRHELIKKASEQALTPEEHTELLALRDKFRSQIAGPQFAAGPRLELTPEEIEQQVDHAMAQPGALPAWPEGTTRERARELYIAATQRALTDDELAEIGLSKDDDAEVTGESVDALPPEAEAKGAELMAKFGIAPAVAPDVNAQDDNEMPF